MARSVCLLTWETGVIIGGKVSVKMCEGTFAALICLCRKRSRLCRRSALTSDQCPQCLSITLRTTTTRWAMDTDQVTATGIHSLFTKIHCSRLTVAEPVGIALPVFKTWLTSPVLAPSGSGMVFFFFIGEVTSIQKDLVERQIIKAAQTCFCEETYAKTHEYILCGRIKEWCI